MKYEIGQQVWRATCDTHQLSLTCPDCGGTGRLRVILHDETQVSIDCANCAPGYDPPTGKVKYWAREARAVLGTISGVEIEGEKATWKMAAGENSYWRVEESNLFDTQEAALAKAEADCAAQNAADETRILTKEKDTRSWAWNASYHRKRIKEAQRDLEYHTKKLNVAAIKAKEPVA